MPTKIDMIGIFVDDLPQMVAFYRDALGFGIEWDGQGPYAEFKHEGVRSGRSPTEPVTFSWRKTRPSPKSYRRR